MSSDAHRQDARYRSERELQAADRLEKAARAATRIHQRWKQNKLPLPGRPCNNPVCPARLLPGTTAAHPEPIVDRVLGRVCIHGYEWPEEASPKPEDGV